jgi:hypothetical protein
MEHRLKQDKKILSIVSKANSFYFIFAKRETSHGKILFRNKIYNLHINRS